MKPTVGRIVHYTNLGDADGRYPPEQQAALITKVKQREDCQDAQGESCYSVSLHIFYETGDFYMQDVPYSDKYERGHWTWPPREGENKDPVREFIVNAVAHCTNAQYLTYEEVVALAQDRGHPTVVWSIKGTHRGGTLAPGGKVAVNPGLIFTVAHTDNA